MTSSCPDYAGFCYTLPRRACIDDVQFAVALIRVMIVRLALAKFFTV